MKKTEQIEDVIQKTQNKALRQIEENLAKPIQISIIYDEVRNIVNLTNNIIGLLLEYKLSLKEEPQKELEEKWKRG